jgi:hypothetical protein
LSDNIESLKLTTAVATNLVERRRRRKMKRKEVEVANASGGSKAMEYKEAGVAWVRRIAR